MHDGGLGEAIVAVPPRRLRQRKVDLHLGAAEAKPLPRFGNVRRNLGGVEQAPVELRRRDVADDCTLGSGGVTPGEPDSERTTALDENALHVPAGLANAALIV